MSSDKTKLKLAVGQASRAGIKAQNQDYCGALTPNGYSLFHKGAIVAVADGISSSQLSHIASQTSINTLLTDYYATPVSWGTESALKKVLQSLNSWLYAQTRRSEFRYELDKGYVCTLSGLVFKSNSAFLFHVGDSRVYRIHSGQMEQLTEDHRYGNAEQSHTLTRAMGMREQLDLQVAQLDINVADTFLLATDGVYEWLSKTEMSSILIEYQTDMQKAAEVLVETASANGSTDNLTAVAVSVEQLPVAILPEFQRQHLPLPLPAKLSVGQTIDSYQILKVLHQNHRSSVYLAYRADTDEKLILKMPATDFKEQAGALEHFLTEEWVACRVTHNALMTHYRNAVPKQHCYLALEYFEGQSLVQWQTDQSQTSLTTIRDIVRQIAAGLQAMHRMQMYHLDIRPQNILINTQGQIKIIDYGSTRIEGLQETWQHRSDETPGELQYTAPECLLGWPGTEQADLYSLACVTYYLLSGTLPYGASLIRQTSRSGQRKQTYQPLTERGIDVPVWLDYCLRKALHIDPNYRYTALSEFVYDLSHPNPKLMNGVRPPLLEKHPVAFWQAVSAILALIVLLLAATHPLIIDTKTTGPLTTTSVQSLTQEGTHHDSYRND